MPEAKAFGLEAVFSTLWQLVGVESSFDCSLKMAPANTSDTNCLETSFSYNNNASQRGALLNKMHIEQILEKYLFIIIVSRTTALWMTLATKVEATKDSSGVMSWIAVSTSMALLT